MTTNDVAVVIRHELGRTQQPLAACMQCDGGNCEYVVMTLKLQCFLKFNNVYDKGELKTKFCLVLR
jgi:hypothetical protein